MSNCARQSVSANNGAGKDRGIGLGTTRETEEESEEAYQLRQRHGGDGNNKYTKRSNIKCSQHLHYYLALLAGLLIWMGLYCFTQRDWIESLLVGIPKRHRRAWLPGRDWFPTDPYTLPPVHYEQFQNRTEVTLHCPSDGKNISQLANVIEIFSAFHNGLYWMGGTGTYTPAFHMLILEHTSCAFLYLSFSSHFNPIIAITMDRTLVPFCREDPTHANSSI